VKHFFLIILFLISSKDEIYNPTTFVFPAFKHTYGIRKAGSTELFLFMGFKVNFRDPEGLASVRLNSWEDPEDPHDDDELTVYGVNSGQNNIIYNKSMWALGVYGLDEDDNQLLNRPHGISANNKGDVYVADTGNHRVVRLFNPTDKLQFITAIGTKGSEKGQFLSPHQVAMDNSGNIFVSDSGNHRIQVFDNQNKFKFAFTGNDFLESPIGISVTDSLETHTKRKENFLIITDSSASRINKFDLKGNLTKTISMRNLGFSEVQLEYICIDYHNQILITDSKNHCIHKFTHNLDYITSFGREGDDDFEFIQPTGITIHRRFGQLFVAEESGAQYYWVGTDLYDITIKEYKNNLLFSFKITEPSNLTADLLDNKGKFIMRLTHKKLLPYTGNQVLHWNQTVGVTNKKIIEDEDLDVSDIVKPGKKVPPGKYRIKISLEATYSSRTHFVRVEEQEFEITE
jgi:hypothetical protein